MTTFNFVQWQARCLGDSRSIHDMSSNLCLPNLLYRQFLETTTNENNLKANHKCSCKGTLPCSNPPGVPLLSSYFLKGFAGGHCQGLGLFVFFVSPPAHLFWLNSDFFSVSSFSLGKFMYISSIHPPPSFVNTKAKKHTHKTSCFSNASIPGQYRNI